MTSNMLPRGDRRGRNYATLLRWVPLVLPLDLLSCGQTSGRPLPASPGANRGALEAVPIVAEPRRTPESVDGTAETRSSTSDAGSVPPGPSTPALTSDDPCEKLEHGSNDEVVAAAAALLSSHQPPTVLDAVVARLARVIGVQPALDDTKEWLTRGRGIRLLARVDRPSAAAPLLSVLDEAPILVVGPLQRYRNDPEVKRRLSAKIQQQIAVLKQPQSAEQRMVAAAVLGNTTDAAAVHALIGALVGSYNEPIPALAGGLELSDGAWTRSAPARKEVPALLKRLSDSSVSYNVLGVLSLIEFDSNVSDCRSNRRARDVLEGMLNDMLPATRQAALNVLKKLGCM
jgi:hypothetical protein